MIQGSSSSKADRYDNFISPLIKRRPISLKGFSNLLWLRGRRFWDSARKTLFRFASCCLSSFRKVKTHYQKIPFRLVLRAVKQAAAISLACFNTLYHVFNFILSKRILTAKCLHMQCLTHYTVLKDIFVVYSCCLLAYLFTILKIWVNEFVFIFETAEHWFS